MALYERITSDQEPGSPEKLEVHAFSTALREWSRGAISRAQVVSAFNLTAEDETELDAIASKYSGLPPGEKADFLVKMHDVFILVEAGLYSKAKAKTELGF